MNQSEWKDFISSLENKFEDVSESKDEKALGNLLTETIKKLAKGRIGVAFSGGVDSTFIAFILKKAGYDFCCYTVGIENSQDVSHARAAAEMLGLKLRYKILTLEELEIIVKQVVKIIKEPDVTKVSVGAVLFAILAMAKEDINILFTGLGSEEIFAGYQRHLNALGNEEWESVHNECWNGLKNMWERDLKRDFAIAPHFGTSLAAPFLEKEVIGASMKIHPKHKISNLHKKIILREIAESLGMPKEFAWRGKKAAQYGSGFIKGLDKLAKRNGFKLKKDYLGSLV